MSKIFTCSLHSKYKKAGLPAAGRPAFSRLLYSFQSLSWSFLIFERRAAVFSSLTRITPSSSISKTGSLRCPGGKLIGFNGEKFLIFILANRIGAFETVDHQNSHDGFLPCLNPFHHTRKCAQAQASFSVTTRTVSPSLRNRSVPQTSVRYNATPRFADGEARSPAAGGYYPMPWKSPHTVAALRPTALSPWRYRFRGALP